MRFLIIASVTVASLSLLVFLSKQIHQEQTSISSPALLWTLADYSDISQTLESQQQILLTQHNPKKMIDFGWALIAAGQAASLPKLYRQALQIGHQQIQKSKTNFAAMHLTAESLRNLHRFDEAYLYALALTEQRGIALDFGLLGDIALDQGKQSLAVEHYQKMMMLKPGALAYSRFGLIREYNGDHHGALDLYEAALLASHPQNKPMRSWLLVNASQSALNLQAFDDALVLSKAALRELQTPSSRLHHAQTLYVNKRLSEAIEMLNSLSHQHPSIEALWWLQELSTISELSNQANQAKLDIEQLTDRSDPRNYAFYLLHHNIGISQAHQITQQELVHRQDPLTTGLDAWAKSKLGQLNDAQTVVRQMLNHQHIDPRISLIAAEIALRSGLSELAANAIALANNKQPLLLPSQQKRLQQMEQQLTLPTSDVMAGL